MFMPRRFLVAPLVLMVLMAPFVSGQDSSLRQRIDAEIQAAWKREKVTPAEPADDAAFMRRLYLDLVGTIPTHDESKAFLQDADPARRSKLIDKLFADPRYAVQQAQVWDQVLFGRNPPGGDATRLRPGFEKWLRTKFANNEPYDRWVHELLMAEGNSVDQGPPLFYVQFRAQPEETMVAVSRIFLGTQLACAQCHDHPKDKWKQLDFYGMAAFFARLVVIENGKKFSIGEKRTGEVMFTGPAIEQKPGQKGKPVGAKFLGGAALTEPPLPKDFKELPKGAKPTSKPDFSRKEKLGAWLTGADNPYFTRAIVNRLWGQFMRRGLVHPVDNLSADNNASHPELLKVLEEQFKSHKFDMKWFIRELVNSQTYQLSSRGAAGDPEWFEQARLRPLTAEEFIAALKAAVGSNSDKLPGTLQYHLMSNFGSATDGRGDFQASLTERLFVSNNAYLRLMIQRGKGNLADSIVSSKDTWEQKVDRLYLTILSRPPRPAERERFVKHLSAGGGTADALVEEAIWALLASAEFRFNH
jgi:Protein of unknown function (DUF1549)/Protein of unknown function (DUF1553)